MKPMTRKTQKIVEAISLVLSLLGLLGAVTMVLLMGGCTTFDPKGCLDKPPCVSQ